MTYCINPNCPKRRNPDDLRHCQECGTPLLIPDPLLLQDRYRLLEPLSDFNEQRYTETFKTEDLIDDQYPVKVIKVLRDPVMLDVFQEHARMLQELQKLKHPGIPRVEVDGYFIFSPKNEPEGLRCLVMEHIEGLNLKEWLAEHKRISQELALDWLKQMTEILEQLHQHRIFHRDIKPSNIMLRQGKELDGQLVLIDFATARVMTDSYLIKMSGSRGDTTTVISSGYTSLEQINGRAVPQSDFYSMGRTFVHLMTGMHPNDFPEDGTGKLLWHEKAPQISEWLADFIDDLMAILVSRRPLNTQEILRRLETNPAVAAENAHFRQLFALLVVINIGLCIALLSTLWLWWRQNSLPAQETSGQIGNVSNHT